MSADNQENDSNKDLAENFLKFGKDYQDKAVYKYDVLRLTNLFCQIIEAIKNKNGGCYERHNNRN